MEYKHLSLQRLGAEIGHHLLRRAVHHLYLSFVHLIHYKEVPYVDMFTPSTNQERMVLMKKNTTLVILKEQIFLTRISLSQPEISKLGIFSETFPIGYNFCFSRTGCHQPQLLRYTDHRILPHSQEQTRMSLSIGMNCMGPINENLYFSIPIYRNNKW